MHKRTVDLEASNEALQKKEELLNLTQSANNIGAWELDLETGVTYWSDEVYAIREVASDFDHNKVKGTEFYHPDDQGMVTEAIEHTIQLGAPFDVTARFITAKNNESWVRATGRLREVSGNKQMLIGSFQDVTQFKQNERLQNFSIIVTHNLRSHAGGIIGMLEILKYDYPEVYSNEYI